MCLEIIEDKNIEVVGKLDLENMRIILNPTLIKNEKHKNSIIQHEKAHFILRIELKNLLENTVNNEILILKYKKDILKEIGLSMNPPKTNYFDIFEEIIAHEISRIKNNLEIEKYKEINNFDLSIPKEVFSKEIEKII